MNVKSLKTIQKALTEIATVKRAEKNLIYPKNTIYVQVSACKKSTEYIWNILGEEGYLENKYAVVIPKINIIPEYLVVCLERVTLKWMHRYVGKAINISMDLFKYLKVDYHESVETQLFVLSILMPIKNEIELIKNRIANEKKAKNYFLAKMM